MFYTADELPPSVKLSPSAKQLRFIITSFEPYSAINYEKFQKDFGGLSLPEKIQIICMVHDKLTKLDTQSRYYQQNFKIVNLLQDIVHEGLVDELFLRNRQTRELALKMFNCIVPENTNLQYFCMEFSQLSPDELEKINYFVDLFEEQKDIFLPLIHDEIKRRDELSYQYRIWPMERYLENSDHPEDNSELDLLPPEENSIFDLPYRIERHFNEYTNDTNGANEEKELCTFSSKREEFSLFSKTPEEFLKIKRAGHHSKHDDVETDNKRTYASVVRRY